MEYARLARVRYWIRGSHRSASGVATTAWSRSLSPCKSASEEASAAESTVLGSVALAPGCRWLWRAFPMRACVAASTCCPCCGDGDGPASRATGGPGTVVNELHFWKLVQSRHVTPRRSEAEHGSADSQEHDARTGPAVRAAQPAFCRSSWSSIWPAARSAIAGFGRRSAPLARTASGTSDANSSSSTANDGAMIAMCPRVPAAREVRYAGDGPSVHGSSSSGHTARTTQSGSNPAARAYLTSWVRP